jgi:chromosome segregation ATPase
MNLSNYLEGINDEYVIGVIKKLYSQLEYANKQFQYLLELQLKQAKKDLEKEQESETKKVKVNSNRVEELEEEVLNLRRQLKDIEKRKLSKKPINELKNELQQAQENMTQKQKLVENLQQRFDKAQAAYNTERKKTHSNGYDPKLARELENAQDVLFLELGEAQCQFTNAKRKVTLISNKIKKLEEFSDINSCIMCGNETNMHEQYNPQMKFCNNNKCQKEFYN